MFSKVISSCKLYIELIPRDKQKSAVVTFLYEKEKKANKEFRTPFKDTHLYMNAFLITVVL